MSWQILPEKLRQNIKSYSERRIYNMKHLLTEHDIQKMKEEIEHRKVVVRKELLEHVKEARAHRDLSENFEYHAAKKEKNRNESRIRYLERMIRNSKVVEEEQDKDTVGINTTVELLFEEDQETELIVKEPYDEMYVHWLSAQIDWNNREYAGFNATNAVFEATYSAFRNAFNQTHMPKGGRKIYY